MKIVISGYGKMGRMIEKVVADRGLDYAGWSEDIASFDRDMAKDCVCIDFTTPEAFRNNYKAIAENFRAAVVGTTGWYDIKEEVFAYFEKCGTTLVWASNFSIGVIALTAAVDRVSEILAKAGGYSASIVEKHHIHKLDAPSGTALTLAAEVRKHITAPEVEIASVRIGELPGIHTVSFEGMNDRLTLEHEAFSRKGLAEGAVTAAQMAEGLDGVHEFKDLILL